MDIFHLLERRALISRGAARDVVAALKPDSGARGRNVELDFQGIEAVTPSFVDELISQLLSTDPAPFDVVRFKSPPSRLSEKFRAIGRGRGLAIEETSEGDWVIELTPQLGGIG